MDAFGATRLVVGMGFLLAAAWSDLRTRTVRDPLWIGLGTIGLVLLSLELATESAGIDRFVLVMAMAILFYAIFFGRPIFDEDGIHFRPARLSLLGLAGVLVIATTWRTLAAGGTEATDYARLVSAPIMVLVYQGFYYARLLHGGADAKALIAVTLLVPTYPVGSPLILASDVRVSEATQLFFPFSLAVFVDAAILFLFVPLAYLIYNAARGDLRLPQALLGYRADLEALPKHVWLMERIDERGGHYFVLFPRRGKDQTKEIERLRQAGVHRPWVQPKLPFLAPLAAGFLTAFMVGNVLLFLFPGSAR